MINMADTRTKVVITSLRTGITYIVYKFYEYSVDIDLETDSDQFNVVFGNPGGQYTGLFEKFDSVVIVINDEHVLYGFIDELEYICDESEDAIRLIGRDVSSKLVDNDVLPGTLYNVNPASYIEERCAEYAMYKLQLDTSLKNINKLEKSTGQSEISVMNNLIVKERKKIWTIFDTLYMGDWNTNSDPKYYLTRGFDSNSGGIPIKSLKLRDSGLEMKSEVLIYGSMGDGSQKVLGTAKNDYMISKGVKKRKTITSSDDDSVTKYSANALYDVQDSFKSGIQLSVVVKTGDKVILPNNTAHVIDIITKINSVFFIKAVRYDKNSSGSITTITMIPGDTTFNVLWSNLADPKKGKITGTPTMSFSELINSRK